MYKMKEEKVSGDGNCGYTALNTSRDQASQMLLFHLDQVDHPDSKVIAYLLACEIEDSFKIDAFPPDMKQHPLYKQLKEKRAKLDLEIQKQVTLVNKTLKRPEGDKWSQDKLLEEYFTQHQSEVVRVHMQKLIELTLQEQSLEEEEATYCHSPETLKSYVQSFIQPSASDYGNHWDGIEINWLTFSTQKDTEGHYRPSGADAIARALGKNLAIWTEGKLSHIYLWNLQVDTMHLFHKGGNHFNRLVLSPQ